MSDYGVEGSNRQFADVEQAIRFAKGLARGAKAFRHVIDAGTALPVAIVWPNGKVDITWAGSRTVSTWRS